MPKYVCKSNVGHDGKNYAPGDTIELSEAQASAMPWAVELAEEPAPPELKKYRVLAPFQYEKVAREPGDVVELPDEEAAKREGKLELIEPEVPPES